jgi:hypothetical protein
MGKYVLVYKGGGVPQSEEEQQRVTAAWMSWLGGLGSSVVDMGNPFGASTALGANGSTSGLTGYSIVNADSLDDAKAKAQGCPILEGGRGGVEVYETIPM